MQAIEIRYSERVGEFQIFNFKNQVWSSFSGFGTFLGDWFKTKEKAKEVIEKYHLYETQMKAMLKELCKGLEVTITTIVPYVHGEKTFESGLISLDGVYSVEDLELYCQNLYPGHKGIYKKYLNTNTYEVSLDSKNIYKTFFFSDQSLENAKKSKENLDKYKEDYLKYVGNNLL